MACPSLTALPRACGTEGIVAGLEKLYIIAFNDLAPASGDAGDPVYTTAVNGMVSDIGLAASKTYVEVGLLKSTASVGESGVFNPQNGVNFVNQTVVMVLGGLSVENRSFVEKVMNQPVSILLKSRTGKWYVTGLNGQLELSALEGGTGTAPEDLNGYTLTFTGIETGLMPQVEAALISTIIA